MPDGRVFDILEFRVLDESAFEQEYLVEMELQERATQNTFAVRVQIHFERRYGTDRRPAARMLLHLAREETRNHFFENRYPSRFSSHCFPIDLQIS